MKNWMKNFPNRYWAYLALAVWGVLCIMLLGRTPYGIDEGAARALLLIWSIVDNVVSPVAVTGLADFRTVFLVPAGILWTGNILAAKITTIVVMVAAVLYIYRWRERSGNAESALFASGLLLLSPLVIDQIDSISVAPYLLVTFALGAWADTAFREKPLAFGGMYFSQMFLCLVSTSLHPAGLAYPLVLLWIWHKSPVGNQRGYYFGGIIFSVLFALLLTQGWQHVEWFANPLRGLSGLILGSSAGQPMGTLNWILGVGMALLLLLVVWRQADNIKADLLGQIMLVALAAGIIAGDDSWAVIALAITFYWGFSLLLNTGASATGAFLQQRWVILSIIFVTATSFMLADKKHYLRMQAEDLLHSDNLIKALVEITSSQPDDGSEVQEQSEEKPLIIASQWPGRTMLACRCGAVPLPPSNKDGLKPEMLRGIDYLIFDHKAPQNRVLSQNLAMMNAGNAETVELQEGGVIIKIKVEAPAKSSS